MKFFSDEVEVGILPDEAHCMLDEKSEYILNLSECPLGHEFCSGNCYYYTEDRADLNDTEEPWS